LPGAPALYTSPRYEKALAAWLKQNPEGSEADFRSELKKEGSAGYLDFLFFWSDGTSDGGSVSNISLDDTVSRDFWDHHRPYLIKGPGDGARPAPSVEYDEVLRVRKVHLAWRMKDMCDDMPGTATPTAPLPLPLPSHLHCQELEASAPRDTGGFTEMDEETKAPTAAAAAAPPTPTPKPQLTLAELAAQRLREHEEEERARALQVRFPSSRHPTSRYSPSSLPYLPSLPPLSPTSLSPLRLSPSLQELRDEAARWKNAYSTLALSKEGSDRRVVELQAEVCNIIYPVTP